MPQPDAAGRAWRQIHIGLACLAGLAFDAVAAHSATVTRQDHDLVVIRRLLMALTQNEQAAVNDLANAIGTLATDLDTVMAGAKQVQADLQTQITTLQGQDAADQATIAALQAAADAIGQNVIDALTPLTAQVQQMDSGLQTPPAQGGSPLTAKKS